MTSPDPLPRLLAPFTTRPDAAVVCVDFDGTLSAIVDDPGSARPLPGVVDLLHRLAARYRRVCVVSGRPASFLHDHLDGGGVRLIGLYGLEWVDDGRIVVHQGTDRWRHAVDEAGAYWEREAADTGLVVEHKGLSATLHYRLEPDLEPSARRLADAAAARTGLVVHPARMSYELRPPVERDKGVAVAEAAEGASAVCFLGDDRGDLPAFDALDRLSDAGVHVLRVGVSSPEAPPELLERADVVVDGPAGVVALLSRLGAD